MSLFAVTTISNRRPEGAAAPDFKTLSTNGSMQFSQNGLNIVGAKEGDYILAAGFPSVDSGLEPTLPGGNQTVFFTKGIKANKKTGQNAVGSAIVDTNNKMIVSSAFLYGLLGGNKDTLREFSLEEALYGFCENNGVVTPVYANTPNDGGNFYAFVAQVNEKGIVTGKELVPVDSYEDVLASEPMYCLTYVKEEPKQMKGGANTANTAKGKGKKGEETFVGDFEEEE